MNKDAVTQLQDIVSLYKTKLDRNREIKESFHPEWMDKLSKIIIPTFKEVQALLIREGLRCQVEDIPVYEGVGMSIAPQDISAPVHKWPSIRIETEPPTVKITITNSQDKPYSDNQLLDELTQESIEATLVEFLKHNLAKWA
jgi:hypothetical protein